MASSTRGGKRGSKSKKIHLTPSKKGGYIYQSDRARKSLKEAGGLDELDKAIDKAYTKRMMSGELTPEESGTRKASTSIDRIHDSHFEGADYEKPRKKAKGGAVRGYANGGAVRGYKGGGKVGGCRGGGAAMAGTKFSGCK